MRNLVLRLLAGVLLGIVVWVGLSLYADVQALGDHLESFTWPILLPVLGLTITNYLLRFVKWHYLLGRSRTRIPRSFSLQVFLAGFSMGVTPGKIGELLKSYLLKRSHSIPMARTAPVVIAERLTDLLALLLLCLLGVFSYAATRGFLLLLGLCGLAVGALTIGLTSKRLMRSVSSGCRRIPGLRRVAPKLDEFVDSMARLLTLGPLALTTGLSVAAWLCECLGFVLILYGVCGEWTTVVLAVFIYSATTVLGAMSFLPGGLGVTEGSMTLLLIRSGAGLTRSGAAAATLLIRLCTLWFGVLIGIITLLTLHVRRAGLLAWSATDASTELRRERQQDQ